jgi:hypothetical protein
MKIQERRSEFESTMNILRLTCPLLWAVRAAAAPVLPAAPQNLVNNGLAQSRTVTITRTESVHASDMMFVSTVTSPTWLSTVIRSQVLPCTRAINLSPPRPTTATETVWITRTVTDEYMIRAITSFETVWMPEPTPRTIEDIQCSASIVIISTAVDTSTHTIYRTDYLGQTTVTYASLCTFNTPFPLSLRGLKLPRRQEPPAFAISSTLSSSTLPLPRSTITMIMPYTDAYYTNAAITIMETKTATMYKCINPTTTITVLAVMTRYARTTTTVFTTRPDCRFRGGTPALSLASPTLAFEVPKPLYWAAGGKENNPEASFDQGHLIDSLAVETTPEITQTYSSTTTVYISTTTVTPSTLATKLVTICNPSTSSANRS